MAVLSVTDLMTRLRDYIGDDNRDETLNILEDITDTVEDMERRADNEEWQRRYDDLDRTWRDKYRERFFKTEEVVERRNDVEERRDDDETKITYEDLFEERR